MDAFANFAYGTVLTPPSPATSGTTLVLNAGQGALMPATPFNAVVWPAPGPEALTTNAEIVRVTGIATDTLTIVRQTTTEAVNQSRAILVGDQVMAGITGKTLSDIGVIGTTLVASLGTNTTVTTTPVTLATITLASTGTYLVIATCTFSAGATFVAFGATQIVVGTATGTLSPSVPQAYATPGANGTNSATTIATFVCTVAGTVLLQAGASSATGTLTAVGPGNCIITATRIG